MSTSSSKLDSVLEEWEKYKKEIASLEKKCDLIKSHIEKKMKDENKKLLTGNRYCVIRSDISRKQLVKDNVPSDIYEKYSKTITYSTYKISLIDEK